MLSTARFTPYSRRHRHTPPVFIAAEAMADYAFLIIFADVIVAAILCRLSCLIAIHLIDALSAVTFLLMPFADFFLAMPPRAPPPPMLRHFTIAAAADAAADACRAIC